MTTPTSRSWVVTTASERITPDSQGRAEITVTVTNLHDSALPATLAIITSDDTTKGWFSVADADRVIDAGASVPFVVTVSVPPQARAAEYAFQASVQSTGASADEEGVRSSRVLLDVPPPARIRRTVKAETIVLVVAGILVLAVFIGGVVVIALPRGKSPQPLPSTAGPTADSRIVVPNVLRVTDPEAIAETIEEAGLVPVIKYLYRPDGGGAIEQEPLPDAEAAPGDVVNVKFAADITAPYDVTVTFELRPLPPGVELYLTKIADVELAWKQDQDFVASWQVWFFKYVCEQPYLDGGFLAAGVGEADTTRFRALRIADSIPFLCGNAPREAAYIVPVDDFGNLGPTSELIPIDIEYS